MKIKNVKKLVANLHDKTEYFMYIRNLKQALNRGMVLKNIHKLIQINQNARLKPYIYMNTDLRKKHDFKMVLKNIFLNLMNDSVFGKTMGNVRKHRGTKLVRTERRRNYLESE